MYALFGTIRFKPDHREVFMAASHANGQASLREESGCLRFDFLFDRNDPLQCYFYEVYRDEAAFRVHEQTPHFDTWTKICGPLITEESEMILMETSFPGDTALGGQKRGFLGR